MNNFLKISVIIIIGALSSCALNDFNEPCSITITIVDTANKGINDVAIEYTTETEKAEVKTDVDGKVKIKLAKSGICSITYSKIGFTTQSAQYIVYSNENKTVEIKLKSLLEDAFLKTSEKEVTFQNTGVDKYVGVNTNVNFEIESTANWLSYTKSQNGITLKCDSNQTELERFATVIIRGNYNQKDSIKIRQLAGPVLVVQNYLGKGQTSFPNNIPFVTFSREISVVSVQVMGTSPDYELSSDKKTIYFKNIKLGLFSEYPINLTVKASDNIELSFTLNLRLYVNAQSMPIHQENSTFFTKDNAYCWIFTGSYEFKTLKQYSTSNFNQTKQILNEQVNLACYNPYNNCLYLNKVILNISESRYLNQISVYDANTAELKSKFDIDYNGKLVESIVFSENGYGLMKVENSLLYIDAAKNHEIGIYSNSSSIYDPHQSGSILPRHIYTYNKSKLFMLYGENSSGTDYIFSSVPESKIVSTLYTSNLYQNFYTSNSGTKAVFTYYDYNHLQVYDLETRVAKTVTLPSVGAHNVAFLTDNTDKQYIYTTKGWLISLTDYSIKTTTTNINHYYMFSSDDGKYLLINNNGKDYLYRSEIFTNFSDYIK